METNIYAAEEVSKGRNKLLYIILIILLVLVIALGALSLYLFANGNNGGSGIDTSSSATSDSNNRANASLSRSSSSNSTMSNSEKEITEERKNTTFRNTIWGDSLETVQKYETEDGFVVDENMYGVYTRVSGKDVELAYMFENDKLVEAIYNFDIDGYKGRMAIGQYYSLQEELCKIYGEPYHDEIIPLTSQALIDHADEYTRIELGYVAYMTEWKTDKTHISLLLGNNNYKMFLSIQYLDINHEPDSDGNL